jgi:hypothetical protein
MKRSVADWFNRDKSFLTSINKLRECFQKIGSLQRFTYLQQELAVVFSLRCSWGANIDEKAYGVVSSSREVYRFVHHTVFRHSLFKAREFEWEIRRIFPRLRVADSMELQSPLH